MIYIIEINETVHEEAITFVDAGPSFGDWFRDVFLAWLRDTGWPRDSRSSKGQSTFDNDYLPYLVAIAPEMLTEKYETWTVAELVECFGRRATAEMLAKLQAYEEP